MKFKKFQKVTCHTDHTHDPLKNGSLNLYLFPLKSLNLSVFKDDSVCDLDL